MNKAIIHAVIYTGSEVIEDGFIVYGEQIVEVGHMNDFTHSTLETIDAEGKIIIPGMIDIHIHGGYTVDAMDADPEKLLSFSEELLQEGVTSFFATTMTQSKENIANALAAVPRGVELGANIAGIHLEGPYVNVEKAGAQPHEYIIPPDVNQLKEWNERANGMIKLVTFAPEKDEDKSFQSYMQQHQIVCSAGHTDATFSELAERKITHFTHLYNQMKGLHHREPGTVGYALLNEQAYVELIVDGIHVHPEMVRLVYKMKGPERICIITDAMRAKGLPDGRYELGGQPVSLKNETVMLDDGTLAGSALTMDRAFRNIIQYTGCSIEEAVKMTSVNQAREFHLTQKGAIAPTKDSDFVLLDEHLQVVSTFTKGRKVDV